MSKETIMLAKAFKDASKLNYPVTISEKLDGVAADFYREGGMWWVQSRQGEPILSVKHIIDWLDDNIRVADGWHIIVELYIPDEDFKVISGLCRRHTPAPELVGFIYDTYFEGSEQRPYRIRMEAIIAIVGAVVGAHTPIRLIPQIKVDDEAGYNIVMPILEERYADAEGFMIREMDGKNSGYKAGWRSPGMLKLKKTNTIDLRVTGFEEAMSKYDEPLHMVGRINCEYEHAGSTVGIIGVGPGKLTHEERTEIWNNKGKYIGAIAEVKYMPDESYDALREPRFIRWRFDKDTVNQED